MESDITGFLSYEIKKELASEHPYIDWINDNCTPETGIDDIRTEREKFDKHLATLRIKTDEAMRGLGGGNFGG